MSIGSSIGGSLGRAIGSALAGGGQSFAALTATGGTITDTTIGGRAWRYHRFTASADFVVTALGTDPDVTYLAVGSGASGAHFDTRAGMGGGAGGMVRTGTFTPAVTTYPIVVGAPGAGVTGSNAGTAGGNVTGLGVTAEGGSGGGGYFVAAGNGVNGGGGGCTVTTGNNPAGGTGTNFAGGTGYGNTNSALIAGGGGAGAGGAGGAASASLGGTGGAGIASSITGASIVYGAGAGGNALVVGGAAAAGGVAGVGYDVTPNAGTDGLGNGGSGAGGTVAGATSGAGGKGVFIVGYWTGAP